MIHKSNIVIYMKEYAINKKIKELLMKINPLLTKNENNIRIHLEALTNGVITEDEFRIIETKIRLGKLCLDLEEKFPDGYVCLFFYNSKENNIHYGAAPSFPVDFFKRFFTELNETNSLSAHSGPCGCAIHQRKVVVTDFNTCPLFKPYRDHFVPLGFQSGWFIPFYKDDDVGGAFAFYHKLQRQLTFKEILLIQQKIAEYQDVIDHMSNKIVTKEV